MAKITRNIPRHVAIIMDGNGRWANSKGLPRTAGHKKGIDTLRSIVENSVEFGVQILSVYVFSTENWKRPTREVDFLMKLFDGQIERQVEDLHKNQVKVRFLGDIATLPRTLQEKINKSEEKTSNNKQLILNVMINYGGRQEIVNAVKNISREIREKNLSDDDINAETFSKYLYTGIYDDPELLIRTGGEYRISNFMLWQLSYAELYITEILWPDFNKEEYDKALAWYSKRNRRFGGI